MPPLLGRQRQGAGRAQQKRNWISAALAPHDKFTHDAFASDRQISIATQNDHNAKWPMWVKMRRTRIEHMSAGLPPITDIARRGWHGRKVPTPDIAAA